MASKREVEVAETLAAEKDEEQPRRPADGPPVTGWDRYELLELLGKGGMGAVYKARDRRLDRILAIKFLHSADPSLTTRFLREARAQGKIEHPNVCSVYEAGEVQGRAYIALQYIDGEPLHRAAARMSLDQKVGVMRDVAVAVAEAHRHSIIHCDLKPGNVLVEHRDEGRWFPIVMDFGLAREVAVELGITQSGIPLGTPAYMAPEQARGDVHAIDHRSDVYGLGATLYELLTGQPPFTATAFAEALARAIRDDPPAPRGLVPSLPVDLETIALKCLAKDPAQRYPSARALADDLDRYLAGEPILGRRLSPWQRARLRARRHRALVILGSWSLAAIVTLAALAIRERVRAADRARLTQQLGQEASEIEDSLREAYLLPLHDIRQERASVRERMRAIAGTHPDLGKLGEAIVHEALGRGHLALHEWREAADELARADALGRSPTPELHAARGRALGELYRRAFEDALEEVQRSGDRMRLVRRQQELAAQLLAPAREQLDQSRAPGRDTALLDAQIALYRGDFAAAEQQAARIAGAAPWLAEPRKLAGDAAYRAAGEAFGRGDHETARAALQHATAAYAKATEIVRSDPSVYRAAAEVWLLRAELDFRQGRSPSEALDRARELIDNGALRADPEHAPAYTTRSNMLLRRYRTVLVDQEEEQSLLDRAIAAAARAVEIDRGDALAWVSLGAAHTRRGNFDAYHGGQGAPWWMMARADLEAALAIQPANLRATNGLGTVHRWLGSELDKAGGDPTLEYNAARRAYQRATELDPRYIDACSNRTEIEVLIAEHDAAIGSDPHAAVEAAERIAPRCLELDRSFYQVLDTVARGQLALAQYRVETGGDPTTALRDARQHLEVDETIHPGHTSIWYQRLVAARIAATYDLRRKADPTSWIKDGRIALDSSLKLMPESAYAYVEAARLDLIEAAWAARVGRPAEDLLDTATRNAETAARIDKRLPEAALVAAEAYLELATARSSRDAACTGLSHVEHATALNPRLLEAEAVRAGLQRRCGP